MDFDIIILGSGLAGYTLAKEFRRLNTSASLLIISSDDGCYYSKPMLSTGFTKHKSASALVGKSAGDMAEELNASIFAHTEVQSIDKDSQTLTVENSPEKIHYRQALVLATGAEPITIGLPDALEGRCLPINDLADYGRFQQLLGGQKNVAIIGSGLVGTEYANDMIGAGLNINVIALDDGPLQLLLPPPLSVVVKDELAKLGINWHFNCSITAAQRLDNDQLQLTLSSGEQITCDLVLSAVGLRPRVRLAAEASLDVRRGIVVDEYLRTTDPHIFALGDCAEINGNIWMYVAPLTQCAKALAKTLNGNDTPARVPASPVIVKTPGCPVVSNPPPSGISGQWQIEGDAPDLKATFWDERQQLAGFCLTGKKVMERMRLAKQLPELI